MLPQIGDRLQRRPNYSKGAYDHPPPPQSCVVRYVNRAHRWYMVEFANGFRQCFKVPEVGKEADQD